jgi:hypothetical protein
MDARYSIGTWDGELQAYTPQCDCKTPWLNVDIHGLRAHLWELRRLPLGYSAHRIRDPDGDHWDNDTSVLVERTDGMSEREVFERWER